MELTRYVRDKNYQGGPFHMAPSSKRGVKWAHADGVMSAETANGTL